MFKLCLKQTFQTIFATLRKQNIKAISLGLDFHWTLKYKEHIEEFDINR